MPDDLAAAYAKHYRPLVASAARHIDWHEAEDVVSALFLALMERPSALASAETVGAGCWLWRNLDWAVVDRYRRTVRTQRGAWRRHVSLKPGHDRPILPPPSMAEQADDVWALLRALPWRQAEVMVRTYVQGERLWEVAESWGVTEARAVQVRTQARKALA